MFLPLSDRVIYVRDGEVSAFADLPKLLDLEDFSEFHERLTAEPEKSVEKLDPTHGVHANGGVLDTDDELEKKLGVKAAINGGSHVTSADDIELDHVKKGGERCAGEKAVGEEGLKLIAEETTMVGNVRWKVYGTLLKYATFIGTVFTVLCHSGVHGIRLGGEYLAELLGGR